MINRERVLQRFLDYVQIDSVSYNEKEFAERLYNDLKAIGLDVEIDNTDKITKSNTGNVIAKLKGNIEGEPILFSCHMDTVTPGIGVKPVIRDGAVYSDGTTILGGDDKGGIAAIIEALTAIKEDDIKHPTIEIAFTIAEEVGMFGAKNLDYSKFESKMAYVLDTSGDLGVIVTQGPAQDKIIVNIKGKAAHAGVAPETGISAINIAADAISNMKLLRVDEDTTANIGKIVGGTATNIVCPEINIDAEARSTVVEKLDKQTSHMVEEFKKACEKHGGEIKIDVERLYGAFTIDSDDKIVKRAKKAFDALGIKSETQASGGGSDTNIFNVNGIKSVNLASGERSPHTLNEHVFIDDLENLSKVVIELIKSN